MSNMCTYLARNPHITSFKVERVHLTEPEVSLLSDALKAGRIQRLSLIDVEMRPRFRRRLSQAIREGGGLEALTYKVVANPFEVENTQFVLDVLEYSPLLKSLEVCTNTMSDAHFAPLIVKLFPGLRCLYSLSVVGFTFSFSTGMQLAQALSQCDNLMSVDFNCCVFLLPLAREKTSTWGKPAAVSGTSFDYACLWETFGRLSQLRSLNISSTDLCSHAKDMMSFTDALRQRTENGDAVHLEYVNVAHYQVKAKPLHFTFVAELLNVCPRLSTISLAHWGFGEDPKFQEIASACSRSSSLTHLDFSSCLWGVKSASCVSEIIKASPSLASLDISNSNIYSAWYHAFYEILKAIPECPTFKQLLAVDINLLGLGLDEVCTVLSSSRTLTVLDLRGCGYDELSARKLALAVRRSTSLEKVMIGPSMKKRGLLYADSTPIVCKALRRVVTNNLFLGDLPQNRTSTLSRCFFRSPLREPFLLRVIEGFLG